jgi:hypothetical protein
MKRLRKLGLVLPAVVALAGLVVLPINTAESTSRGRRSFGSMGTVITSTTLDAASSTFEVENHNHYTDGLWALMSVWVKVTDGDNSVTAITMSCTGSEDQNTTDFTLQSCVVASGACTSSNASWVKDPSGMTTKNWVWRVDIEGVPDIECTFTDTGGDASDSIIVGASFAMK